LTVAAAANDYRSVRVGRDIDVGRCGWGKPPGRGGRGLPLIKRRARCLLG
jgi:hypothetical protein